MPEVVLAPGPKVAGKRIPVPAVKHSGRPTDRARKSAEQAAQSAKAGAETGRAVVRFARNVAPRQRPTRSQSIRSRAIHRAPAVTAAIAAGAGLEYLLDPVDGGRRRRSLRNQTLAARRRFAQQHGAAAAT